MLAALFLFGALSHVLGYQKLPGDHWCHLVNLIKQRNQVSPLLAEKELREQERANQMFEGEED